MNYLSDQCTGTVNRYHEASSPVVNTTPSKSGYRIQPSVLGITKPFCLSNQDIYVTPTSSSSCQNRSFVASKAPRQLDRRRTCCLLSSNRQVANNLRRETAVSNLKRRCLTPNSLAFTDLDQQQHRTGLEILTSVRFCGMKRNGSTESLDSAEELEPKR